MLKPHNTIQTSISTLRLGDFNAKLEKKLDESERRNCGYSDRNASKCMLLNYLQKQQCFAINSYFHKKYKKGDVDEVAREKRMRYTL